MNGRLYVARRKSSTSGKNYTCVVFSPDADDLETFVVSFDKLLSYEIAAKEGVAFEEYVEDDTE